MPMSLPVSQLPSGNGKFLVITFYIVTAVIAVVTGAVVYPLVRRDLSPRAALLATGCLAMAVCAGWVLALFHVLVGCMVGLVVYLVMRRHLTGVQAVVAGGVGYVVGTLLSVVALMIALSGM
ncbi:hypothetical protein [Streptomyces iranensis]|uniref:hypothetical protein n=1 Tax=Streptomyces iranensis TaxID=576784 RepID=UPI0039B767DE